MRTGRGQGGWLQEVKSTEIFAIAKTENNCRRDIPKEHRKRERDRERQIEREREKEQENESDEELVDK